MKKKNDLIDKAEIVDDPTKKYSELKKINNELGEVLEIERNLNLTLDQKMKNLAQEIIHDETITKPDTVSCIKNYLNKIMKEYEILKDLNPSLREKLYSTILNLSIMIFDYCRRMRFSNYSIHGTKYLMWIITLLESNIILAGIKYLRWRVKLYIELALLYEDNKAYKSAFKVIEQGIRKVNELKSIEEQRGNNNIPEYIKSALIDSFRLLKNFEFKFGIFSGIYQIDIWKKKIDETFTNEKLNKLICIVNCLSSNSSIIFHEGIKIPWKSNAVMYLSEQIKSDLLNVRAGIGDYIEKNKREVEKRKLIKNNPKEYQSIIEEFNKKDANLNKNWRITSKSIPIEIHMELVKACYDCKMWKEFTELLECLNVRILYRSLEMPYLSELDVINSSVPYCNTPNKFDKIDIDLNINNYKAEIKKLREQGKFITFNSDDQNVNQSKNNKTNTNKSVALADNKKKGGGMSSTEDHADYNKIEGLEHSYVYLLVKRTHNPTKAIIKIRVILSNDSKIITELTSNERAFAIPIKTYEDNLYEKNSTEQSDIKQKISKEKNNLIPYLIYTKSDNGLTNEEEKLSAIVDILPFVTNSPFADPPINFTKIPTELTIQITHGVQKKSYNFSHNYINICYKTDQNFYLVQKECDILKSLYELEITYIEDKKTLSKIDNFLEINYSLDKLEILSKIIYNSIQGPTGNFFLTERRNFIYDNCVLIWKKYLKDVLMRIHYFFQINTEIEDEEQKSISNKIFDIQSNIFNILFYIHFVLSKITIKDPIMFAYLTIHLGDFAEKTENITIGIERINKTLEYLNANRERENIFGLNNYDNKHTFTTFTCDNNKIYNLFNTIEFKYDQYVRELNFKRRKNYRENLGLTKLSLEEEVEEDFEITNLENEYKNRLINVFKKNVNVLNDSKPQLITSRDNINLLISENENTLNCLIVNLNMIYYRLYLKNGINSTELESNEKFTKINNQDVKMKEENIINNYSNTEKLLPNIKQKKNKISNRTVKKLDIIKCNSSTQVKENIHILKSSLQQAGKLDPDKPNLNKYEKKMLLDISKNTYLSTLFHLTMSMFRTNKQDQKFILNHSSTILSSAYAEEENRFKYYDDSFFYIKSFERFNKNSNTNGKSYYPYSLLYKEIMIKSCQKIPEPILIHKTSASATFIFPIVKIKSDEVDSNFKVTSKVALFGQESTGTNIVALGNKQLQGTGTITSVMNYVTVRNLKQNERHIFAYAGYDYDENIINGIGVTSKEVENYFPLPLNMISYHLCKITFELKQYEICKEKAKNVFNYFTERTDLRDVSLDNKMHSLLFYKLRYDYILRTCMIELEAVAYCFLLFAKCMLLIKPLDHSLAPGVNLVTQQKNILKNLNVLMLGLELTIHIRHYLLIKTFVKEIYNVMTAFIKLKSVYKELLQLLIRLSIGINIIPNDLWDCSLRNLSSLISYHILVILVAVNEVDIFKKFLVLELGIDKKRFFSFKYQYMRRIDDMKKPKEKDKIKSGMINEESNNTVLTDTILLTDLEKEIIELDEFILTFNDFNDVFKTKASHYINLLEKYSSKFSTSPELTEELEKRKKDLNQYIDVWDGFKNEGLKFLQKYALTNRESDKYYEFSTKLLHKTIESNFNLNQTQELNIVNNSKTNTKDKELNNSNIVAPIAELLKLSEEILIKESDTLHIQNIFSQKLIFLNNDIIFSEKKRIKEFLDKVEKEIIEEKNKLSQDKSNIDHVIQAINLEKIRVNIEDKFFGTSVDNERNIPYDLMTIAEVFYYREKYFWIGDLIMSKAILMFTEYIQQFKNILNLDFNNFVNNYKLVDISKLNNIDDLPQTNAIDLNKNKKRSKIFEKLATSALFFDESSSHLSLDKLISFLYNILIYDMISPKDTMTENQWCYLNIIAEIAIKWIGRKLNRDSTGYIQNDYKKEIEQLKWRLSDKENIKQSQSFNILKKFSYVIKADGKGNDSDNYNTGNEFIENSEELDAHLSLNLDIYIEIICFSIQCTFYAKKWTVLTKLIKNFNTITNDLLCDFTLPFLIEAQKNIWAKANENTLNKQIEINQRVAIYDTWKNSRKKNKRQQMITGEIPQEQIDFEKDHYVLNKELFIFESISNLLQSDKEKSEKLYSNLLNDSKNTLKALNSCRKLFEKYQIEASSLSIDLISKGENHFDVKSKSKAIKIFAQNLINLYQKAVRILKKRQENYLLIQVLYEMSLVYYSEHSDKDIKNSEIFLNESLDTVFQKLYSLKEFRKLFESVKSLPEKYGLNHLFFAVMILHKLGKYCYDNDLYWQRESAIMVGEIIYNILIAYIPHPNSILNFALYRMTEINKNSYIFKSDENIKPADLLISCIETVEILKSYGDYELCLPLLSLSEYLACDIVKNINFLHRVRVYKVICLSELGLISEAIQIYYKIIRKFDTPTLILYSVATEKIMGRFANLTKEFKFLNNLPPEKNQDAINSFLKLSVDNELKFQLGCSLFCELNYAKALIVFKIYEKENYSNYLENNILPLNVRNEILIRIEKEMREVLTHLAACEELNTLQFIQSLNLNNRPMDVLIDVSYVSKKIEEILTNKKITREEFENFYIQKFNKSEVDLRKERIDLICKIRIVLSRIFTCQGLILQSSGVLIRGLENLKKYCSNNFISVEVGDDYIFDIKFSESSIKGKPLDNNKKTTDNKKLIIQNNQNQSTNLDEEVNKIINYVHQTDNLNRNHPNAIYWFKLQYMHIFNLYKMGRYEDCLENVNKLSDSVNKLNDTFSFVRIKEIETYIHMLNYNLSESENKFQEIIEKSKSNYINDIEYAVFLSNISEFYYFEKNKSKESLKLIKEARLLIWMKMSKLNYQITSQNINNLKLINNLEIDKNLKSVLKERELAYSNSISISNRKPTENKKKEERMEISPINYTSNQHLKVNETFEIPSGDINNSDEGFNLYFKYTDLLCRIDLKFVLIQLIQFDYEMSPTVEQINISSLISVLNDLEVLSNKMLYAHSSFKIILYFLFAKVYKLSFIYDLNEFLNSKMTKISKKYKLDILSVSEVLNKFSNSYNEKCLNIWISLLLKSKEYLEKSLSMLKGEFYTYENGFSVHQILLELSDINIFLAEYRPSLNPKYCDFNQIVNKFQMLIKSSNYYDKENDDLPYLPENFMQDESKNEKTNWLDDRNKHEKLLIMGYIKNAEYYCGLAHKVIMSKIMLNENISELANVNLIDASKLPKDVAFQILENDFLNKKRNKIYLNNLTQKSSCDAFDVYNLLKNYTKEAEFFTLNNEDLIKNISKIHKFLKLNSVNYLNKIYIEIIPSPEINDSSIEILKKDQIIIYWNLNSKDLINHNPYTIQITPDHVNFVYIIGQNSTIIEFKDYLYGRVLVNKKILLKINKCLFELKIKLKNSLVLSEQKKKRDFINYQMEYNNLITEFSHEILKNKKNYEDIKSLESFLKKEYVGEVSTENIDFWLNVTNFSTFNSINQKFNALLSELHVRLFA